MRLKHCNQLNCHIYFNYGNNILVSRNARDKKLCVKQFENIKIAKHVGKLERFNISAIRTRRFSVFKLHNYIIYTSNIIR